jgi:hypothetical protein
MGDEKNSLSLTWGSNPNRPDHPGRSQSLYRLSYSGSNTVEKASLSKLKTKPNFLIDITAKFKPLLLLIIQGCIQKFLDWPPGARTANGTALCR